MFIEDKIIRTLRYFYLFKRIGIWKTYYFTLSTFGLLSMFGFAISINDWTIIGGCSMYKWGLFNLLLAPFIFYRFGDFSPTKWQKVEQHLTYEAMNKLWHTVEGIFSRSRMGIMWCRSYINCTLRLWMSWFFFFK